MSVIQELLPELSKVVAYGYDAVRSDESEAIISAIVQGAKRSSPSLFLHVAGIPGAGKSTYIAAAEDAAGCGLVQFDAVMERLSGYREVVATKGAAAAFAVYEMPARVIGYEALSRLIDARAGIVFEHSLNPIHLPLYTGLRRLGYFCRLVFIDCPVGEAVRRTAERERLEARHVPAGLISERADMAMHLLPQFEKAADQTEIVKV